MTSTVIVAGARTPMGRFNGALASVSATDLGGVAIRGALAKSGVAATDVDYVIMGRRVSGRSPLGKRRWPVASRWTFQR